MCGRYTLKRPRRLRLEGLDDTELFPVVPRYNIAPGQSILAIVQRAAEREAALLQWGLIPSWSKEGKGFINARAETLQTKPSFQEAFQRRRCLILADGFYEWEKLGKERQPYYFQMKDEAPFCFAGIWDEWQRGSVSIISCAIITTIPNEMLAPIHNRMPVILPPESQDLWLNDESTPVKLRNLLAPFPASEMKSHPVSKAVNHPKNDNHDLVVRVDAELGMTPRLF